MPKGIPPAPPGLKPRGRGRALWREVLGALELDVQEIALLIELARTFDLLDELDDDVKAHGVFDSLGKVRPAVVERRQQQIVAARLVASLRLPADLSRPERRPQRRGASRGVYEVAS